MNPLTPEESDIIINKHTDQPFQNEYDEFFDEGVYICKQCNQPLFSSKTKFDSGCGWPSFDEEYPNSITRHTDADGSRTEIVCSNCKGHLGHVFTGEGMTDKNTRHCVNSTSIKFIPQHTKTNIESVVFGGGCFWCTEAVFTRIPGVTKVLPGYSGGHVDKPTYEQVCTGDSGHAEVIKIEYDNKIANFDKLLEIFFATHDPTTLNQQGNDIGPQYRSVIFYTTLDQKEFSEKYVQKLMDEKKFEKPIVTKIQPFIKFYEAEDYHKNYFERNPNKPYCNIIIQPKIDKVEKMLKEAKESQTN